MVQVYVSNIPRGIQVTLCLGAALATTKQCIIFLYWNTLLKHVFFVFFLIYFQFEIYFKIFYNFLFLACRFEGKIYYVGDPVISNVNCQNCFCTEDGVKCMDINCSPVMEGCIPKIPDGHCCPVEYSCSTYKTRSVYIFMKIIKTKYDETPK